MIAFVERYKGRGYKDRLLNLHDEFWDRKLGVQTFGYHPAEGKSGDPNWKGHYNPTPYNDIFRLLHLVHLNSDDVFVDLGSGMGRTVFAASWLGAARAIGVEFVQTLSDRANDNLRRSRLADRNIEFLSINAEEYINPAMTVCFMFHPFGEAIMAKVLRNIELVRGTGKYPKLRIVYMNPVYDTVLKQLKWLECIGRIPPKQRLFSHVARYETSLWQSR